MSYVNEFSKIFDGVCELDVNAFSKIYMIYK